MSDMIMRGKYGAKVVTDFGFVPKRDDLISRAAAIEAALNGADDWDGGYNPERERRIREHMAKVPSVDAAPVVHAQWMERHVDYASDCAIDEVQSARCSICGLYHTTPYLYNFTAYKFCPNCGAKMDKEA